jgi:hypothetical protein
LANGALLTGLLYDDRGNRMTPSFTNKRGVRYRSYVSSALLKGQKQEVGTLPRISGPDLEAAVINALRGEKVLLPSEDTSTDREIVGSFIDRVEVSQAYIRVALKSPNNAFGSNVNHLSEPLQADHIDIPWRQSSKAPLAHIEESTTSGDEPDPALVQAIARAHSWIKSLTDETHNSIESLAASVNMHPKVIRKSIRLAFLAPEITEAVVLGRHPKSLTLTELHGATPLCWAAQRRQLRIAERGNTS